MAVVQGQVVVTFKVCVPTWLLAIGVMTMLVSTVTPNVESEAELSTSTMSD